MCQWAHEAFQNLSLQCKDAPAESQTHVRLRLALLACRDQSCRCAKALLNYIPNALIGGWAVDPYLEFWALLLRSAPPPRPPRRAPELDGSPPLKRDPFTLGLRTSGLWDPGRGGQRGGPHGGEHQCLKDARRGWHSIKCSHW